MAKAGVVADHERCRVTREYNQRRLTQLFFTKHGYMTMSTIYEHTYQCTALPNDSDILSLINDLPALHALLQRLQVALTLNNLPFSSPFFSPAPFSPTSLPSPTSTCFPSTTYSKWNSPTLFTRFASRPSRVTSHTEFPASTSTAPCPRTLHPVPYAYRAETSAAKVTVCHPGSSSAAERCNAFSVLVSHDSKVSTSAAIAAKHSSCSLSVGRARTMLQGRREQSEE